MKETFDKNMSLIFSVNSTLLHLILHKSNAFFCKGNLCKIVVDADFVIRHDSEHPDADQSEYVKFPNIEAEHELLAMMAASQAYEEIIKTCM